DGDRNGAGGVGIEPRMRLGANRPVRAGVQVEQQLVGIKIAAEAAKRRPLQITVRSRAEVAVEMQLPVFPRNMQLVLERVENLDSILGPLGERRAMPGVFV